ncbi:hypothetical protein ACFYON_13060 [Micromonospora sp. NPDC005686]|uniref:hypothetical protein n=1 Tax=unclassified Micromonospora TaxID=2617518 RepID=UPI0033A6A97C
MNVLYRMAVAAVPGGLGAAALAALWRHEADVVAGCESDTIGGCLSPGVPILLVGPLLVTAAVWFALRATGAEPAGWGAGLGALATVGGVLLQQAVDSGGTPTSPGLAFLLGVVGFGAGAAVVAVPVPPALRVVLVLVLLAPMAAFPAVRREAGRAHDRRTFAESGLALVVPRAPGYDVTAARADPDRRLLWVTVTRSDHSIYMSLIDLPADFAPPARCGPAVADVGSAGRAGSAPGCRQVGPDHWTRSEPVGQVHLVRRGETLVLLEPGYGTPSADVETAARTLTPVSPARLAELANR